MPRGKDWMDLVRSTFHSVGRDEMSGLYVREWRQAREKLTAEEQREINREPKRWKRFLKSANAVLFGLSTRLAPARRVIFGAALLFIFLSFNWSWSTKSEHRGTRRVSEYKVSLDSGFLLASITLLTLLLAMELVDKINYRDELELARELQSSLIPKTLPTLPDLDLGAYTRIANMVGGDIYDFVVLPDGRLAVLFGDASGHGMAAGLVMAVAHAAFRTQLETDPEPAAMIPAINRLLCRTGGKRSFFAGVYILAAPDGTLSIVVAGHPQPLRVDAGGHVVERVGRGAYPLGVRAEMCWPVETVRLAPGELLLLYSDGLPEARDNREVEFGEERIEGIVRLFAGASAQTLVTELSTEVTRYCGRVPPE